VGRELAVEIEVGRRLRAIDAERVRREERQVGVELQEIHEELCSIASDTSDLGLRERLLALCDRMVPPGSTGPPLLTERERQVIAAVAVGRTNIEVADELSIMPTTVKTYLKNAMRKLGTRNRVETIHAARCAGLIG
jgi:DNA-binding CsgD family transcriptional regulator